MTWIYGHQYGDPGSLLCIRGAFPGLPQYGRPWGRTPHLVGCLQGRPMGANSGWVARYRVGPLRGLGEMPRTGLAKQGPRVISLLRVMLGPNLAQCTAGLCSSACCLGCAHGCVPRGRLAMGVLFAHGLCTATIGTLHPPRIWHMADWGMIGGDRD